MSPRVALVTGASSGIGRACADRLAERGWEVVGASRRGTGDAWTGLVMDVDDDESVRRGVEGVLATHGRLDAVVAAAGWGVSGPAEETPLATARAQLETNFWGVVRVVNAALPAMRRQRHGRLILVSSLGGVIALPFQSYYSASKFALEGYGEALAYEVAPYGIQVTLAEPGNFATGFTAARLDVALAADSPYAAASAHAIARMARDEEHGAAAEAAAKAVVKVLERRRAPRRVTIGKVDERIGVVAKRLLPFRVFERAARTSLGV